jgi:hypothetical protein
VAGTVERVAALLLDPDRTDGETDADSQCLWAWLAVDDTGDHLIAGHVPGVGMVSLVTTSETHARSLLRDAALALPRIGRTVELRRYDLAEVIERL